MVKTDSSKAAGVIVTIIFHAVFALLLIIFGFQQQQSPKAEEALLINFGDSDVGSGLIEPSAGDTYAQASPAQQEYQDESPMTQDYEDAPSIRTKSTQNKITPANKTVQQNVTTAPVEKPREVNKRALFPGRSNSNLPSQGEGEGRGFGNQGNINGSPDSKSRVGGSTGSSRGHSFSLSGRHVVGGLPNPAYNVQASGKVIVAITVNQSGSVTKATYSPKGSTTSDSRLIHAALAAAQRARFNVDQDAPSIQTGFITYIFNLQ